MRAFLLMRSNAGAIKLNKAIDIQNKIYVQV